MASCETCGSKDKCSEEKKKVCNIENNPLNRVQNIIGVMSGKGGVGKSTVSVLLANELMKNGYKVGIMDADITGPSIPRLLGIQNERVKIVDEGIIPYMTSYGLKVVSLNLFLEEENQPVLWRGPLIAGMVKQFWTDVIWGDLDYLIVDMPPGTGDVAITVMQCIPIDGIAMVTVPQDMVSMIVSKAINMTRKMDIPVLGVIENMSYIICPDCNTQIQLFDKSNFEEFLKKQKVQLLGELPMCKDIISISDEGLRRVTKLVDNLFIPIVDNLLDQLENLKK